MSAPRQEIGCSSTSPRISRLICEVWFFHLFFSSFSNRLLVAMKFRLVKWILAFVCSSPALAATLTSEQIAQLPPPANHQIDFSKEIKPIFEASCIKCHGRGKDKGGFAIDTRETFLKGGDSGEVAAAGKSGESLLIEMVSGLEPDNVMP